MWIAVLCLSALGVASLLLLGRLSRGAGAGSELELEGEEGVPGPTQRYVFSHVVLASMFFDEPTRTIDTLSQEDALEFLGVLWQKTSEGMGLAARQPHGLDCQVVALAGGSAVLVEPPAPLEPAEAHFVAMVARGPADRRPRYFTLELAADLGEGQGTFLCEWTPERNHVNLGPGPSAERDAFLAAVSAQLEGPAAAEPSLPGG